MKESAYKYLDIITGAFVAVLIISAIADTKPVTVGWLSFGGGTFLFPVSYIFGDILTEVYGFRRARRVIWIGFACLVLMALTFYLVKIAPPSPDWTFQEDFTNILGLTPRIVLGSMVAFFFGEFTNSITLAKMKVVTQGRHLWARTIGSTIAGQLVDTAIFMFVAFYGVFPTNLIVSIIFSGYLLKVATETLFTPVTYWIVNTLKKKENQDYYDRNTDFNPFEFS